MKHQTIKFECDLCGQKLDDTRLIVNNRIAHEAGWAEIVVEKRTDPDEEDMPEEKHICSLCISKIEHALRKVLVPTVQKRK